MHTYILDLIAMTHMPSDLIVMTRIYTSISNMEYTYTDLVRSMTDTHIFKSNCSDRHTC